MEKDNLIPIIDFHAFLHGTQSDKQAVAKSITHAFQTSGFLYLKNHSIPPSTISEVFSSSAHFFARPQHQKDALRWTTPQSNRGYLSAGQEKLTPLGSDGPCPQNQTQTTTATPDLKETIEIGKEGVKGSPNHWPDRFDSDGQAFKSTMVSFFDTCRVLYMRIMQAIALGMGMDEHFFDPFVDNGDNNLRLLHYPPVGKDVFGNPAQVRAGEHSDYGSITLLFQDRRGGLQVRRPDGDGDGEGGFVDVVPVEGTVVVNAGDLLARWSNDTIRSTRHRVVEPPSPDDGEETTYPARYSVAYFCNPNLDSWIEALPGTYETVRKYEGIKTEEYLVRRLTATI